MHIDKGKLRAYLDQALPPNELEAIEKQIAGSPEMQTILAQLRQERDRCADHFATLSPPQSAPTLAPQALNRLQTHVAESTTKSIQWQFFKVLERMKLMFNPKFIKQHPSLTTTIAAVVLIAILFSFAPIRVMAANLLSVFRVQQVKVVRVNMNALDRYEDDDEMKGLLDRLDSEPEKISGDDEPTDVNSLDEAAGMVDFSVARIQALPENTGDASEILVYGQTVHHLNLDKDLLEEIFNAAGIELSLPDSLNERPIIITRPNGITQVWGSEESKELFFAQFRSPEIDHPDDLDIKAFGVAILQFLGKSEEEAAQLGESIDWANTLLLPIPNDEDVNTTEVSINGADGVLFNDPDHNGASVMWTTNGISYMLGGNYSGEQVLEMARSVQQQR